MTSPEMTEQSQSQQRSSARTAKPYFQTIKEARRQRALRYYDDLRANAPRYNFYQVVRRLENLRSEYPTIGQTHRIADDSVRLAHHPSLAFATSTIADFEPPEGSKAPRVETNFLGLLGPNAPMPLFFSEYVYERIHVHALRSLAELVTAYLTSPVEIERDRNYHAGLKGFTRQPDVEAAQELASDTDPAE